MSGKKRTSPQASRFAVHALSACAFGLSQFLEVKDMLSLEETCKAMQRFISTTDELWAWRKCGMYLHGPSSRRDKASSEIRKRLLQRRKMEISRHCVVATNANGGQAGVEGCGLDKTCPSRKLVIAVERNRKRRYCPVQGGGEVEVREVGPLSRLLVRIRRCLPCFQAGPRRCIFLGLDAAGKTSILYALKLGRVVTTIPTIGFNVETISHPDLGNIVCWDVGGKDKIRPLWRHYFANTGGIVFCIDSADHCRIDDVRDEIQHTLREEQLQNVPVLFIANKQDLPNALTPSDLALLLDLESLVPGDVPWRVQGASALQQRGLWEGLHWLSAAFRD